MIIKPNTKLGEVAVKLLATTVSLAAIREAGGVEERVVGVLVQIAAFRLLGEVGVLSEPPLSKEAQRICERDGATLHVWGTDLVHTANGKETVLTGAHGIEGDLGSCLVHGHTWTRQEMVAGIIRAVDRLRIEPQEIRPVPTAAALPDDPQERATALLEMIWPWLRQHDLSARDTALLCTTLVSYALMHTPDPELAAWVRENVGTIMDKVIAKTSTAVTKTAN